MCVFRESRTKGKSDDPSVRERTDLQRLPGTGTTVNILKKSIVSEPNVCVIFSARSPFHSLHWSLPTLLPLLFFLFVGLIGPFRLCRICFRLNGGFEAGFRWNAFGFSVPYPLLSLRRSLFLCYLSISFYSSVSLVSSN
jgi:hypothetical protein